MDKPPKSVLEAYELEDASIRQMTIGNVNLTFELEKSGTRTILQRLNPIFSYRVNEDIHMVTTYLAAIEMITPRIIPTKNYDFWCVDASKNVWRLQTKVDGINMSRAASAEHCRSAGALVGKFQRKLADFPYRFVADRLGVHDTEKHLEVLRTALEENKHHSAWQETNDLAQEIFSTIDMAAIEGCPERKVHGDAKINNIIFSETGEALCLIDLDTLSDMPIPVEMGDAFRSWCNLKGEDDPEAELSMEFLCAAIDGYAQETKGWISSEEATAIPAGIINISLELAARFCYNALDAGYFGWDKSRYKNAWEHHLVRARGQVSLARLLRENKADIDKAINSAFFS